MTQTIQEFEPVLRESATFDRLTIQEIQRAAATGIYDIRGGGTKRKVPHFDDLLLLGASMSRYPLEGYRENAVLMWYWVHALPKTDSFKNSCNDCRYELWCIICQCQRIFRPRCLYGRYIHHHR